MKKKTASRKCKKATPAPEPKFGLADLAKVNERSIADAGQRYFPKVDASIPDMKIESFDESMAGMVGGEEFRDFVNDIAREIREEWQAANRKTERKPPNALPEPKRILCALGALADSAPGCGGEAIVKARQGIACARKKIEALYGEGDSKNSAEKERRGALTGYSHALSEAKRFLSGVSPDDYTVEGRPNACGLRENGALLLFGEWGMGKTHSLCALADSQGKRGFPALLVLAESFDPGESPGDALAQYAGLAENLDGLLRGLDALGRESGVRALLLIDSINESPNNGWGAWCKGLGEILKQVRRFPHVGLVVSCRDPFQYKLPATVRKQMLHWEHRGFENPLEAQRAFLKSHDISPSDIPLMGEEGSRPLTLRIICEEIRDLPQDKRQKEYDEIVSGQKGMNAVFERYIRKRAKSVAQKHSGLSKTKVWELVKDDMAGYMAKNLTNDMPGLLFLRAVRTHCSVGRRQAMKILGDMVDEGIIARTRVVAETGEWSLDKPTPTRAAIRMPFQRFGDHIVARKLFDECGLKGAKSAEAVREKFKADKPLGQIFLSHESVALEGWREALILEFPERVKRMEIPDERRELLFNLPDPDKMRRAYRDSFIDGLHLRANRHITGQTVRMVAGHLRDWEDMASTNSHLHYMGQGVAESVLSLSRRRHSRLAARHYLYGKHVKPMKMPDRDILWGSVMRKARRAGWTDNLFAWLDGLEKGGLGMPPDAARNYIALLSLFLGTTDRSLRNRATRALVMIGEAFPADLFSHALDTLDFDDIYYPERMLAASYGVAMSLWNNPKAEAFHSEFPEFAHAVVKDVFMPGGRLLTHHAAVRDYALGIANIARKLGVEFSEETKKNMLPPFPAVPCPFPAPSEMGEDKLADIQFHTSRSDFENHVLGGLVPNRRAHDYKNRDYAILMRQIERRMQALGYSESKFRMADQWIWENQRREPGKVDRYKKKYMWIAYYEMVGWMHATGKLSETHIDSPRSLMGLIDPSFPVAPPEWNPQFESLPMNGDDLHWVANGPAPDHVHIRRVNNLGGLRGPWVLLEGSVERMGGDGKRFLSSHLRGFFVQKSDIPMLRRFLSLQSGYPEILRVMDFAMTDDVFAGEIPWSPDFINDHSRTGVRRVFFHFPCKARATASYFFWEDQYGGGSQEFLFPTPDICARLKLTRRGRSLDLLDENGRQASSYRTHAAKFDSGIRSEKPGDKFEFLHLRKDLLDEYLRATGKRLIWIVWGDRLLIRGWREPKTGPDSPEIQSAYRNNDHIHKWLIEYDPEDK